MVVTCLGDHILEALQHCVTLVEFVLDNPASSENQPFHKRAVCMFSGYFWLNVI